MTPTPPAQPLRRSLLLAVALLALAIVVFEIALTRVLAIAMWHHFTYMVISIALLGFGAAGSLLTARGEGIAGRAESGAEERRLARLSTAFGVTVIGALLVVMSLPIDTLNLWQEKQNLALLLLLYAVITVPFLFGGMALGIALTRFAAHVHRVYFYDLAGSAVGAGASVALLASVGAAATVVIGGCLGVVAGFLFALAGSPLQARRHALPLFLAIVTAVAFATGVVSLRIPFAPHKEMSEDAAEYEDARLPSATAEVEISHHFDDQVPVIGGNFGVVDAARVGLRVVAQDGTAPTAMYRNAADIESFRFLDDTQAASGYRALAVEGGVDPRVLVIGVGGGIDVMVALHHGASRIDAVEINRAMIEMVTERYDDYLGGLFREGAHPWSDRLALHHGEGRSFLRHSDRRYDLIQMSGVDSFTALSTGAYTLSESYLYTTQAVKEFYAHLEAGGIINYSRFIITPPQGLPRETLRLAHIAATALGELGLPDPASHIAVLQGSTWASTMIRREPFTAAQIADLHAFADRQGFRGLVFDPRHDTSQPFRTPGTRRLEARLHFARWASKAGAAPDAPETERLIDAMLDAADAVATAGDAEPRLAAAQAALERLGKGEFTAAQRGLINAAGAAMAEDAARHAAVCRIFATLLRGDAAERDAFLADYPYDLTPSTDDSPFFFNYYRYSQLLSRPDPKISVRGEEGPRPDTEYHPEYPVGHLVLVASMVQIVALAAVLLFLPLRALGRRGVATKGKAGYLAYFLALGAGFMTVEIVLMQKIVIFLGHPTYCLSVVLVAMLGFAGIGSWLSPRFVTTDRRSLLRLGLILVAVVLATALAFHLVPPLLLGFPFTGRVLAVLAMLAPLGIVLGMPFPTGMRILERECPQLLPWGWAVNGFASVFASLFTIVMSMAFGFGVVLTIAAAIYLGGFLALIAVTPREARAA
jgi:hypothetical protein